MNRRWQKDAVDRYRTLDSYGALLAQVQALDGDLGICDAADLYATYSVLHSKQRAPRLCVNRAPPFHYFLAEVAVDSKPAGAEPNSSEPQPGEQGRCARGWQRPACGTLALPDLWAPPGALRVQSRQPKWSSRTCAWSPWCPSAASAGP